MAMSLLLSPGFAIVRLPNETQSNAAVEDHRKRRCSRKEGVDGFSEMLHTLPSSQLTNTTLCR